MSREPSGVIARSRSLQPTLSAEAPEDATCRRETRGGAGSLAHGDPRQRADDRAARDDRRDTDERDAPPAGHNRWRGRLRNSRLERALQRQPDVADGLHPLSGIFLQAASDVGAQRGRQRRRQPGPVRLTLDDARQRFRDTLAHRTPAAP